MKIEIDLNDIFQDSDYGSETLQESIKRQVISAITNVVKKGIGDKIDCELAKLISSTLKATITELMPLTIKDLMDAEYRRVDQWGNIEKTSTNFRKELVAAIHAQMTYKKTIYESDRNAFTKAVDETVSESVKVFKKDFDTLVSKIFTQECFDYARIELQKKLGVK